MPLIDTHAHLYLPEFDADRDETVQRAFEAGIEKIFLPNIDLSTVDPMLALCDRYERKLFPMIGLHPSSVGKDYKSQLDRLKHLLEKDRYIAVGETGIDLYRDISFRKEQIDAFGIQVEWSLENNLPVVIHSRNSFDEIFSVLHEFGDKQLSGVFHSFTGTLNQAHEAISLGFMLGIGGIVTFKNAELKTVVKEINPVHIILETDAPYLAPVPARGKRNESSFMVHTAYFLATLYDMDPGDFALLTSENALRLFENAF